MAYKSIGIAIYEYIYKVTTHNILQTIDTIGRIYAWRDFSQLTFLFFPAKHTGNVRIG